MITARNAPPRRSARRFAPAALFAAFVATAPTLAHAQTADVHRWYNPGNGDHFYTTDPSGELAPRGGYRYEGIGFRVWASGGDGRTVLFRWYNPGNGDHFYTTDPSGELAPRAGYQQEAPLGWVYPNAYPGTAPLYRWYHPTTGDHFYTLDATGELAPGNGYRSEGVGAFVLAPNTSGSNGAPPNGTGFVAPDGLGSQWDESEMGWSGRWVRRGASNQFDAVWTQGANRVQGVVAVTVQGSAVQIVRLQSSDGYRCTYTGLLTSDRSAVTGTYTCDRAPGAHTFWARIQQGNATTTIAPPNTGGCAQGQTSCGGVCVDTRNDMNHCGACNNRCAGAQVCVNGACVGTGTLRFTMTWDQPGDVDLHVVTPAGGEIYYGSRAAQGGQLDRDDTTGTGPENIFWTASPPPGTYLVCAVGYRVSRPTNFQIAVVRSGQTVQSFSGTRATSTGNRTCQRGTADFLGEVVVP